MGHKYLINANDDVWDRFRLFADRADISVAEVIRRLMDRAVQPPVAYEAMPTISGCLQQTQQGGSR